jgi:hypothetical protein
MVAVYVLHLAVLKVQGSKFKVNGGNSQHTMGEVADAPGF